MPTLNTPSLKTFYQTAMGALAGAALLAGPALADEVAFEYRASELENAAGVAALYERIEARAARLCLIHTVSSDQKACTEDLINDFVSGVDHPHLTARHSESAGRHAENAASVS